MLRHTEILLFMNCRINVSNYYQYYTICGCSHYIFEGHTTHLYLPKWRILPKGETVSCKFLVENYRYLYAKSLP